MPSADDLVVPVHFQPGSITIPATDLRWQFSKSSGPGGQSVNTTDSRVSLSYNISQSTALPEFLKQRALERLGGQVVNGEITVHASEQRSQLQNRTAAANRLAELIRTAIKPPPPKRRTTKPSKRSTERRISQKKQRGETKRLRRTVED